MAEKAELLSPELKEFDKKIGVIFGMIVFWEGLIGLVLYSLYSNIIFFILGIALTIFGIILFLMLSSVKFAGHYKSIYSYQAVCAVILLVVLGVLNLLPGFPVDLYGSDLASEIYGSSVLFSIAAYLALWLTAFHFKKRKLGTKE